MSYMWWEDIKVHQQVYGVEADDIAPLKVTKCPVCNTALGKRSINQIFSEFCTDCNATYTWLPGDPLPTAVIGKKKDKVRCSCSGCNDRDGIVEPEEPEKLPDGQDAC